MSWTLTGIESLNRIVRTRICMTFKVPRILVRPRDRSMLTMRFPMTNALIAPVWTLSTTMMVSASFGSTYCGRSALAGSASSSSDMPL